MEFSSTLEKKLQEASNLDEVVQICHDEGIPITRDQLDAALSASPEGELNEEALDAVSGGAWIVDLIRRYIRRPYTSGRAGGGFGGGGGRSW